MTYVAILKYSLYLGWFVSGLINVCIYWKIPLWALYFNHELRENHIFHPVKTSPHLVYDQYKHSIFGNSKTAGCGH